MKVGDIVEVRFWDHTSDTVPYEFLAWGRITKTHKKYIVLQTWGWANNVKNDPNTEQFTILRSCVTHIKVAHFAT